MFSPLLSEIDAAMSENEEQVRNDVENASADSADVEGVGGNGALLTAEQIAELKVKAAKAEEHWDRLLRTQADLENYRKRAIRERQESVQSAQATLMGAILPALDSFDRALAATRGGEAMNLDALKEGLELAYGQLRTALSNAGLEEINAEQRPFDPNVHEALSQQESAEVAEGQVLQQVRRGYRLRDRLIRPASVIVAKKPAA
jgi:molecular chaperone GrpE